MSPNWCDDSCLGLSSPAPSHLLFLAFPTLGYSCWHKGLILPFQNYILFIFLSPATGEPHLYLAGIKLQVGRGKKLGWSFESRRQI